MTRFEPRESPGVHHEDPAQSINAITASGVEKGIWNGEVQLIRISLDRENRNGGGLKNVFPWRREGEGGRLRMHIVTLRRGGADLPVPL